MSPWYKDGLHFSCLRCGRCCRGEPGVVWLERKDLTNISAILEIAELDFISKYTVWIDGCMSLREKRNGDCVFYSAEKGCMINEVKPMQCRTYPFWTSITSQRRRWESEAFTCPGINSGDLWSVEIIETMNFFSESIEQILSP